MLGTDEESKIVIFCPSTKLGISFVTSGQTTLFFNQSVNFPNFFKNVIDFVLQPNISVWDFPAIVKIFLKVCLQKITIL